MTCLKNNSKMEKRFAAYMVLVELMRNAHFLTFNIIRNNRYDYNTIFRDIVKEKKTNLRMVGLDLIEEIIKETSKRDSNSAI